MRSVRSAVAPQASRPSGLAPDALSNARPCSPLLVIAVFRLSEIRRRVGGDHFVTGRKGRVEPGFSPSEIDTSRPHPARLYDYYLGGMDNYVVDREAAAEVLPAAPDVRAMAPELGVPDLAGGLAGVPLRVIMCRRAPLRSNGYGRIADGVRARRGYAARRVPGYAGASIKVATSLAQPQARLTPAPPWP
jgi:hypothetical protein